MLTNYLMSWMLIKSYFECQKNIAMRQFLLILISLFISLYVSATKLTIVAPNNGVIYALDDKGIRYDASANAYILNPGTQLSFYGTADECFWHLSWHCVGGKMNDNVLTVAGEEMTVRAQFVPYQYIVSADVRPVSTGSVFMELGLGDIFIPLSGVVNCGMTVRMTVREDAKSGYHFVRWSDGNTDPVRSVLVDGDANYTAIFENGLEVVVSSTENTRDEDKTCRKFLENGRLVLESNGIRYSAQGMVIN